MGADIVYGNKAKLASVFFVKPKERAESDAMFFFGYAPRNSSQRVESEANLDALNGKRFAYDIVE